VFGLFQVVFGFLLSFEHFGLWQDYVSLHWLKKRENEISIF
jgi:hypothetical protein